LISIKWIKIEPHGDFSAIAGLISMMFCYKI